jgi:hypothetical protein
MVDQEDTGQIMTIRRLRWLGMLPLLVAIAAAISWGILLSLLGVVLGSAAGWPGGDTGEAWLIIGGVAIAAAAIVPLLLVIVSRLRHFWPSAIASALCILIGLYSLVPTLLTLTPLLLLNIALIVAGVTGLESWAHQGRSRRALRGLGMALPLAIVLLIGIVRAVMLVALNASYMLEAPHDDSGLPNTLLSTDRDVSSIRFSPDGTRLISWSAHSKNYPIGSVVLWNVETHEALHNIEDCYGRIAWSHDSSRLACVGEDGNSMLVLDAQTEEILWRTDGEYSMREQPAWSPDGGLLAAHGTGEILLMDAETGEPLLHPLDKPEGARTNRLKWSPDGLWLATYAPGELLVWRVESGEASMPDVSDDNDAFWISPGDNAENLSWARDLGCEFADLPDVWTLDGRLLACGSSENADVSIYDVRTQEVLYTVTYDGTGIVAYGWSPDGKRLATAGFDSRIVLWELATESP